MNKRLLALYGLKWNPFSAELPPEALWRTPRLEDFCWRVEHVLLAEGGFALVTGDSGTGKSVSLRLLAERLGAQRDVVVGILTHPQSPPADFYRELGDLYGLPLRPHNRWMSFKSLRERWEAHLEGALHRAVLLIDEAQQMSALVLNELRLLASTRLDSRNILAVVLAGDARLPALLRQDELLPLGSRMRVRLTLEAASRDELLDLLRHLLETAGNPRLMTPELMATLCEHALGNPRVLTTLAAELLGVAMRREIAQLDEKLYLEVFAPPKPAKTARRPR